MGTLAAPKCTACTSTDTKVLESISLTSWCWYFRCEVCRHYWTLPKTEAEDLAVAPSLKARLIAHRF
jgi:hypothetical protein